MVWLTDPAPRRPLLVLGPSLGTCARGLWGRCAALLSDEFEIVGWELPGHGDGSPATEAFSIADLADWVAAGVDALRPGSAFAYAGDSIGGAVGLNLLLGHEERVTSATLACTGARIGSPQGWRERCELVRTQGTDAVVGTSITRWFSPGFPARQPSTVAEFVATLRAVDAESYALTCAALAGFDVRERLSSIGRPVAVIAGADDVATPVAAGQEIVDGVAGAWLSVLDGVGHLAPVEAPERVAGVVRATAGLERTA